MDAATITVVKDGGFFGHPQSDMGNAGYNLVGQTFEQEVREVARALWDLPPGEGASEFINNDEIDCVCRTEELIHLIECTTDGTMKKFRQQVTKLIGAKRHLERSGETVKMRIVTREDPSPQQRSSARSEGITALSIHEFRRGLLNSQQYIEARWKYRFGSASDPEGGGSRLADDEYVQQPLTRSGSHETYTINNICNLLREGKVVVLVGPFGAGKSLTVREVFRRLRSEYYRKREERTPIAINLRDHWGQPRVDEVLHRHANMTGFDHPSQLVRAWNAGQLLPLLDGFDELAAPAMAMNKNPIRRSRQNALRVIRAFMSDALGRSGVLIAGRDHYFDSSQEARELMGLPHDSIFIEVGEFSEEQTLEYLQKKDIAHSLPPWLPRKPLLLGYLASQDLLEEVVSIEGEGGVALAWDQFLDRICRREADLSQEIDSGAVRRLLEDLATRARSGSRSAGSLLESDLTEAYKKITGYEPLEAARTLLQRLPGLTARDQEVGARSFVDDEMMEALQAGPVSQFVLNPYSGLGVHKLTYPLTEFGCSVANHLSNKLGVKKTQYCVAAKEAVNRWSDSTLALDSILAGASSWGDTALDAQGLTVSEGLADVIDMEDRPIKDLTLTGCMINRVRFDTQRSEVGFTKCHIVRLEGIAGSLYMPDSIHHCEIDQFDDRGTNAAIVRSNLPNSTKVLLVIIRKLFIQRGRGRIDSALSRGIDDSMQIYVDPVRNLLLSEGIVYSHMSGRQIIWHGNRLHRSRMLKILERPADSDDPIAQAVTNLASA